MGTGESGAHQLQLLLCLPAGEDLHEALDQEEEVDAHERRQTLVHGLTVLVAAAARVVVIAASVPANQRL